MAIVILLTKLVKATSCLAAILSISVSIALPSPRLSTARYSAGSIYEKVKLIKKISSSITRYKSVEAIALDLSRNDRRVNEKDVVALTSLLDDKFELVRQWAALSLAQIGPRARSAVPALQNAFREVECIRAEKNSRSSIRLALLRIGAQLPKIECVAGPNYGLSPRELPMELQR